MTIAQIEAGTLTANLSERIVSGLLLPYGEVGRTNLGRFSVDQGVFTLPEDVTVLNANLDHNHAQPVATTMTMTETPAGVVGSWRVAKGAEGDALLAAKADDPNARRALSVEVDGVVLRNGKAVAGRVFGAAFVKSGAFPSAQLMAADVGDVEADPLAPDDPDAETTEETATGPNGAVTKKVTTTKTTTDASGATTTIETVTTVALTEPEAPAEQEPTVPNATVPATLTATSAALASPDLNTVFDLITRAKAGDGDQQLMAALTDIKVTGPLGSGGAANTNALQPAWLGELWNGKSYVRKYMPLIRNGSITAQDEKGFVIEGTDELVQPWAGNKTELPSGQGTVELRGSIFQRWGWAADIAREWFDIPANRPIIEAFLRRLANSYAKQTDIWTGKQITAAALKNIVAPEVYPQVGANVYAQAAGMLIQGIDAVSEIDTPSFAIANPLAWKQLIYTPKDQLPEFISLNFGTNGEGTADGTVHVVRGDTGISDTPSVVVGSNAAAHVNELGGASPLNLDALDIARGGIDKAVIGYSQFMADYPDALVAIGIADDAA